MGAAQHEAVDLLGEHRAQVFLRGEAGHLVVQPAFLDQRHEQRAGLGIHPHRRIEFVHAARVGVAVDRGRRADDTDAPSRRGRHRGARAGLDDVEHRDAGGQPVHHVRRHRRHGVARDDQHLDVALQQEFGDLRGEVLDRGDRLHPVGHARGVAEVDDVLERQALHERAHHGEPADAGIEHPDRARGRAHRPPPLQGTRSVKTAPPRRTCACPPAAPRSRRRAAADPCLRRARRRCAPRPAPPCASPRRWCR